jgi:hypothetical protein
MKTLAIIYLTLLHTTVMITCTLLYLNFTGAANYTAPQYQAEYVELGR